MTEVEIQTTSAFFKHYDTTKRIVISEGGGRSGKTFSILQILILYAIQNKNKLISVAAENVPFLRRGAVRDFKTIMRDIGFWIEGQWREQVAIYHFGNGSTIEFFAADNPGKALGAARDVLFLNEANNMNYEMCFQLMARTEDRIWIDYNPRSEFWAHTEIMQPEGFKGKYDFVHTTFYDNELLSESIKELMLARAIKDENYKRVYVQGLLGNIEGLVFPNFTLIDQMPEEGRSFYGLDWGYTNDPTAIIECKVLGDDIYCKQLLYNTRLQNSDIATLLKNWNVGQAEIWADSAEPKSIDFVYNAGLNIKPVEKGKDSIAFGIDLIKQKNLHVTKSSIELIDELRNYTYVTDKNGKILNDPIDAHNHAIDAMRYAFMMKLKPQQITKFSFVGGRGNKL